MTAATSRPAGPDLAGQVALVTGAGRGIGREIALGLAEAGARVALLGRAGAPLTDAARAAGDAALAVVADVTDDAAVRAAVDTVTRECGPVDLLVNNAGRIDRAEVPPWQADAEDWWAVVQANLRGPMLLCRAVLPAMLARGAGRIVNLNSGMGLRAVPDYSAYSVSKAALARFTDCLAAALPRPGPVVFDLSPGRVRTDMTRSMPRMSAMADEDWTPASAVVEAVRTLASGRADALSGRFLHVVHDDLEEMIARAGDLAEADARVLRLRPYGAGDPMAGA